MGSLVIRKNSHCLWFT